MKTIFYPENKRGKNDIGWLKANFSFSFASYHDPEKVHFGALRVLNDDTIAAGAGFGSHPHDNMEIVTIPLEGALEHKDSMGNTGVINAGEVQVMSAGTGIYHSEYNASHTKEAKTLQIWLFPKERNIQPRYDQKSFKEAFKLNQLTTLISPVKSADTLWLNQDATFSIGDFEAGKQVSYDIKTTGNGAYVFVIEGSVKINSTVLNKRDALGVYDTSSFNIEADQLSRFLIIDVPMS
ncbi:pirin family protein [Mucilaginibacter pocheonensis]|uniref:Redox-sensitive bicupin YhaK (Pirin superfamily) n=1 Tax=Mucilaginibacter pocheonensis TaxID=398050 RepID=A0ABU1T9B8_9SPHI|nr:pirin family protein [Mucilaginibacter pocheonensis]MDR6941997.1 redox-sensitive bicupin YhaK (pirin superfamily) [Mucilaginibacter pocheonensis]